MKRAPSDCIALARILILIIAAISGCSNPAVGPTGAPVAGPAGDRFEIPGVASLQNNVLIESVEEDATHIAITWWTCESDGFMQRHSLDASKTVPGQGAPTVARVSAPERQALITNWQQRGYSAQVTDLEGTTSAVSNLFLTFDPPAGYLYIPPYGSGHTTVFKMLVDGAEKEIAFGTISNYARETSQIKLTLHNGDVLAGIYLPPIYTNNSQPYRPRLQGVHYSPDGDVTLFSIPLKNVRDIVFLTAPGPG